MFLTILLVALTIAFAVGSTWLFATGRSDAPMDCGEYHSDDVYCDGCTARWLERDAQ